MKIFINICCYRDPMLYTTVTDAYNMAKYKDSLVFAITDQSFEKEVIDIEALPFKNQIRYFRCDPEFSLGMGWARHQGQLFYDNEDYYLQVDAHTVFDFNWDEQFIQKLEYLRQYHEKPVLTAYPRAVNFIDPEISNPYDISNFKKDYGNTDHTHTMAVCEQDGPFHIPNVPYLLKFKTLWHKGHDPVHGFLISGGCIFTLGKVIEEMPADPFLYFSGEEQAIALKLWTHGYNIFHWGKLPVFHLYASATVSSDNTRRKHHWSDKETHEKVVKVAPWSYFQSRGQKRVEDLCTGKLSADYPYGLGKARTLDQYIKWTGINYINRTATENAITGKDIFAIPYQNQIP
jgi:hypothetical protein